MQTFLPYPSFAKSARVLDLGRLGKQRVETLQILRALTIPEYGWSKHPAVLMWQGHEAALVKYGLETVRAWTELGRQDSTASQILEFAPEVATVDQADLASPPPWLGDPAFHRSHQSNLVRKNADFYGPLFPGVPDDLDYVWPSPDSAQRHVVGNATLWVVRAAEESVRAAWLSAGSVSLPLRSPNGRVSPKWDRQLVAFRALREGTNVGLVVPRSPTISLAQVDGAAVEREGKAAIAIRGCGVLDRAYLPRPVLLQDPRSFFDVPVFCESLPA